MKLVLIVVILIMIGVLHYNHLYAQVSRPNDFVSIPPPPPPVSNASSMDFIPPTKTNTSDFNSRDNNFSPNAMIIALDIALYNQTEIKDYPLTDLAPEEIKAVFNILDSGNVTKVLLNIPVNDIKEIQDKLPAEEFNNILNKVSIKNQIQIKERINKS